MFFHRILDSALGLIPALCTKLMLFTNLGCSLYNCAYHITLSAYDAHYPSMSIYRVCRCTLVASVTEIYERCVGMIPASNIYSLSFSQSFPSTALVAKPLPALLLGHERVGVYQYSTISASC